MLLVLTGGPDHATWARAAMAHAEWLGLSWDAATFHSRTGTAIEVITASASTRPLPASPRTIGPFIHATTTPEDPWANPSSATVNELWTSPGRHLSSNDAKVLFHVETGELQAIVPPSTPAQLVYWRTPHGYVVVDDIRLLIRQLGLRLDPRAVYALFQHGAVPPPLTVLEGAKRVPCGHSLRMSAPTGYLAVEPLDFHDPAESAGPVVPCVERTLDGSLQHVPPRAVLLFSGGVDSGLLAARLHRLGRQVQLINFAFGDADPEVAVARRMASHLNFPIEEVQFDLGGVGGLLQKAGREYSFPFGDVSVVPTNQLLQGAIDAATETGVVLDGTGADGIFGMWPTYDRWKRVFALPKLARRVGAKICGVRPLALGATGLERIGRVARLSLDLSLPCAGVTAQNALDGFAYSVPDDIRSGLDAGLLSLADALTSDVGAKRFSLLDIIHVCAGEFAAKTFDPLRGNGIVPHYPFLEPTMHRAMFSKDWDRGVATGEKKGPLKQLLAESVPAHLVYRPKSGFTPPLPAMFRERSFRDYCYDVVLCSHNPLLPFCRREGVEAILSRTQQGKAVSWGAYYFLWALVFSTAWVTQVSRAES